MMRVIHYPYMRVLRIISPMELLRNSFNWFLLKADSNQ